MAKQSPTGRTRQWLRKQGYLVGSTETYNAFSGHRHDLFGFCDLMAIPDRVLRGNEFSQGMPRPLYYPIFIQVTSGSNHAARRNKMVESHAVETVLRCTAQVCIISWSEKKERGRQKWFPRVEWIKPSMMDCPPVTDGEEKRTDEEKVTVPKPVEEDDE